MYHFTSGARKVAVKNIKIGTIMSIVCGGIVYHLLASMDFDHPVSIFIDVLLLMPLFVMGMFLLVGLFFLLAGIVLLITGGKWEITVTNREINWQAPRVAEKSFRYLLDDVEKVTKRSRHKINKDGQETLKEAFFLIPKQGKPVRLVNQSGVDLDAVIQELQRHSIRLEEEHEYKRKGPSDE